MKGKRIKEVSSVHIDLSLAVSHATDVLRSSGAAPISVGHRPGDCYVPQVIGQTAPRVMSTKIRLQLN